MTRFSANASAKPAATSGSFTSCAVVNSRAAQPTIYEVTTKVESWPVLHERWFCSIWGSLEKRESGIVPSCATASVLAGAVNSANPTARVVRAVVSSLPVAFGAAVSGRDEEAL